MEFVQNFTPPDFQAKNFTPLISPNFNSFSKKKKQKMSENGEIYTTGKNDGIDTFHLWKLMKCNWGKQIIKKRAMLSDDMCKWQKLQMENDLAQNTHNIEREEIRNNKKVILVTPPSPWCPPFT